MTRERGFALILTLFLVALLASALSLIAGRSLRTALAAIRREDDLRRDWLLRSLRQAASTTLPRRLEALFRERLVATREARAHPGRRGAASEPPPRSICATFRSGPRAGRRDGEDGGDGGVGARGTCTVHMVFCDEQAKLNLNALARRDPRLRLPRSVERLLPAGSRGALNPRPLDATVRETLGAEPFPVLERVFEDGLWAARAVLRGSGGGGGSAPGRAVEPRGLAGDDPLADLTIFGSGRLRLSHAKDAALEVLLEGLLDRDRIARLIALRAADPGIQVARAVPELAVDAVTGARVARLLADRSDCHTLRVGIAEDRSVELTVFSPLEPAGGRERTFAWRLP